MMVVLWTNPQMNSSECLKPSSSDVSWSSVVEGSFHLDAVERQKGEIKSFCYRASKTPLNVFKPSGSMSAKKVPSGSKIDVVIDLNSLDCFGYKGGIAPYELMGYFLGDTCFVFMDSEC